MTTVQASHPAIMSAADVGEVLGCSPDTVRRMWKAGTLPSTVINGRRRTPYGALQQWLEKQDTAALAAMKEQDS